MLKSQFVGIPAAVFWELCRIVNSSTNKWFLSISGCFCHCTLKSVQTFKVPILAEVSDYPVGTQVISTPNQIFKILTPASVTSPFQTWKRFLDSTVKGPGICPEVLDTSIKRKGSVECAWARWWESACPPCLCHAEHDMTAERWSASRGQASWARSCSFPLLLVLFFYLWLFFFFALQWGIQTRLWMVLWHIDIYFKDRGANALASIQFNRGTSVLRQAAMGPSAWVEMGPQ